MSTVKNMSIARDRNTCMKNPLSPANGDELAIQSWSTGIGKTKEEINDARGHPVFMAVAQ